MVEETGVLVTTTAKAKVTCNLLTLGFEPSQRALYVQCTYIVRTLYELYVQCTYIVRPVPAGLVVARAVCGNVLDHSAIRAHPADDEIECV